MEFYAFLISDISSITQPIQLKLIRSERLDLNYIFIFETFNHTLTETTIDTAVNKGIRKNRDTHRWAAYWYISWWTAYNDSILMNVEGPISQ